MRTMVTKGTCSTSGSAINAAEDPNLMSYTQPFTSAFFSASPRSIFPGFSTRQFVPGASHISGKVGGDQAAAGKMFGRHVSRAAVEPGAELGRFER